jgi:hypothetical protein
MVRKVISYILVLLFVLGSIASVSAAGNSASVNCSFSQSDNSITVNWGGEPVIGKVKILRDGVVYKDFSNIPSNGSFNVIETEKGVHKYKAVAYNSDGSKITESSECYAQGLGEPQIYLEFLNRFTEISPAINMNSYERIYNWVRIYNQGTTPVELKKIKIRYFYTVDGEPEAAKANPNGGQELFEVSYSYFNPNYDFADGKLRNVQLPVSCVNDKFFRIARHLTTADYICQTYFSDTEAKIDSKYNFKLQSAFHKQQLGNDECNENGSNYIRNYNVINDYSYNNNQNIAVYYDNELIWGNDPSAIVPANLTGVFDVGRIRLNWDTCPGATDYIVYRSETGNDNDFSPIGNVGTPSSSERQTYFDDKDIQSSSPDRYNGKDYYYKVKAVYDDGIRSKYSNMAKVTADPFISNEHLSISAKIVGKSEKSPYFALGTYIPVEISLKLNEDMSNPEIILRNEVCREGDTSIKLIANLVPKNSGSSYLKITSVPSEVKITGNTIQFMGNHKAEDVFTAEFLLKVSPSDDSLRLGIKDYYDKKYLLNFGARGFQNGSAVEANSDTYLRVTILKPDKLR